MDVEAIDAADKTGADTRRQRCGFERCREHWFLSSIILSLTFGRRLARATVNSHEFCTQLRQFVRSHASGPLFSVRREIHCDTVDAVSLISRRWAVIEDMPEMAATIRAVNFGADHTVTIVGRGLHGPFNGGIIYFTPRAFCDLIGA